MLSWIVWLIVAAVLGVAELLTTTLAFGLIAVAAVVAAVIGTFDLGLGFQLAAFALAAGAGLGFVAMNQRNGANCTRNVCPDDSSAQKLNDAKNAADISTGLFIGGGVLAATGFTLWLTTRDPRGGAARVGLAPAPAGVLLHGDW